jgi:hypothetical protein
VRLSPCGRIVDYLHSCYSTPARLIAGSDETFTIRYFRAAKDALGFPGNNAFGSLVWDRPILEPYQGTGCFTRQKTWDPGFNPGCPGTGPIANPEWFLTGLPPEQLLLPPPPPCCVYEDEGTLRFGFAFGGNQTRQTQRFKAGFVFGGRCVSPSGLKCGFSIGSRFVGPIQSHLKAGIRFGAILRKPLFLRCGFRFGCRQRAETQRLHAGLTFGTRMRTIPPVQMQAGFSFGSRLRTIPPQTTKAGFSFGCDAQTIGFPVYFVAGFSFGCQTNDETGQHLKAGFAFGCQSNDTTGTPLKAGFSFGLHLTQE